MPGGFPASGGICAATDVGASTATTIGGTALTAASFGAGSWVQLTASSTVDCCFIIVSVAQSSFNGALMCVDIGVGAAASEVVIVPGLQASVDADGGPFVYTFPLSIPAGTRIAARAVANNGNTDTCSVALTLFEGGFGREEYKGVDVIGQSGAGGSGTVITASGSTHTKGSYAQLIASTAVDYVGIMLVTDHKGQTINVDDLLVDIAIGAAASEVIIIPNIRLGLAVNGSSGGLSCGPVGRFLPIQIPAGTRIAARCQAVVGSHTVALQIYGIYA